MTNKASTTIAKEDYREEGKRISFCFPRGLSHFLIFLSPGGTCTGVPVGGIVVCFRLSGVRCQVSGVVAELPSCRVAKLPSCRVAELIVDCCWPCSSIFGCCWILVVGCRVLKVDRFFCVACQPFFLLSVPSSASIPTSLFGYCSRAPDMSFVLAISRGCSRAPDLSFCFSHKPRVQQGP